MFISLHRKRLDHGKLRFRPAQRRHRHAPGTDDVPDDLRERLLDDRGRSPLAGAYRHARGCHGPVGHRFPAVPVRRGAVHSLRDRAPLPEADSGRENPRPHPLPDLRPPGDGRLPRQCRWRDGSLPGLRRLAFQAPRDPGLLPRVERLPGAAQGRKVASSCSSPSPSPTAPTAAA